MPRKVKIMKKNLIIILSFVFVCFLIICLLVDDKLTSGEIVLTESLKEELNLKEEPKLIEQPKLLTQSEVADYLGLSMDEVIKLSPVSAGVGVTTSEIPFIKIGHKYYYSKIAIDEWLKSQDSIIVQ